MMKKQLLLTIMLCSLLLPFAKAQMMFVHLRSGTVEQYPISTIRKLTHQSNSLKIYKVDNTTVTRLTSDIAKISYSSTLTAINEEPVSVETSNKFVIFPNPSKSDVKIQFLLNEDSNVILTISDNKGSVITRENFGIMKKGIQNYVWSNIEGNKIAAGNYYCTLTINNKTITNKIIIIN